MGDRSHERKEVVCCRSELSSDIKQVKAGGATFRHCMRRADTAACLFGLVATASAAMATYLSYS